jgi:hypothetical protein
MNYIESHHSPVSAPYIFLAVIRWAYRLGTLVMNFSDVL